ncbi:MAG: PKD domain-containing protein [Phycisphaerales bacterium]|nr:PKD domain-containing protein [Phycisphaerales bacterium]
MSLIVHYRLKSWSRGQSQATACVLASLFTAVAAAPKFSQAGEVSGCFADLGTCLTGPNGGPIGVGCGALDADDDLDVDLEDFAQFQRDLPSMVNITSANFNNGDNRLTVTGNYNVGIANPTVELFDDLTGQLIDSQIHTQSQGNFEFEVNGPFDIPCRVRIEIGQRCSRRDVTGAPTFCSEPNGGNLAPLCAIMSPSTSVSLDLGESAFFSGEGSDPEGGALTYEWDMGGGADVRPKVASPGPITFDWNNGSFLVRFIVTDDQGARCTDSVVVEVGLPPEGLPPMVPQQPAPGEVGAGCAGYTVFAFNDLGMHCADLSSYPMSILPPFNTVNAQVIRKPGGGIPRPTIMNSNGIELMYSASSNPNDPVGPGSITSTSQNYPIGTALRDALVRKTDFWDEFQNTGSSVVALLLPGLNPVPDEGLQTIDNPDHGRFMPGIASPYVANNPQEFGKFITTKNWFTAQGIPMTAVDDRGRPNAYPLMRIQAVESANGTVLATTDAVVPVSTEVDCRDCHTLGGVGADPSVRTNGPAYVAPPSPDRIDVETAAKHNLLALHDFKHGTTMVADDLPLLCATCHRSNALAEVGGPGGDPTLDSMSQVAHGFHGKLQVDSQGDLIRDFLGEPVLIDPANPQPGETPLIPVGIDTPMEDNCFKCHPGKVTQCFRGVMYTAGQTCVSCHGGMLSVGGAYPLQTGHVREPWADEPKCGSCHTGRGSDPVLSVAYNPQDPSATPLAPVTTRFAENANTLYRNSLDTHANVACESCHGSPHAIWPHRDVNANDNVPAIQLQGYVGPIRECSVCHGNNAFPNGTLNGPHGMHPVNDPQWIKGEGDGWHGHFAENEGGPDRCAPCHGADHLGTRLARVPVNRILRDGEGRVRATLSAGTIVSCDLCHSLAKSFGDD